MSHLPPTRYIWKIAFAAVALADISYTTYLMQENHDMDNSEEEVCLVTSNDTENNQTSLTYIYEIWHWGTYYQKPKVSWVGPIFCALCLVEAVLRSCDARRMALHNRALDELEQRLLKFAHQGSRRLSRIFGGELSSNKIREKRLSFIDRWMKFNRSCWTWIPAGETNLRQQGTLIMVFQSFLFCDVFFSGHLCLLGVYYPHRA